MVKLSKPGKMPCPTWSIPAWDYCPGSKDENGKAVDACDGCYARGGRYMMRNVQAPRLHNVEDWKRDEWVSDMVEAIKGKPLFRWFDSGDVYDVALAVKIKEVMSLTPETKHWLPTRSYKIENIRNVLFEMQLLENATVRFSSDSVKGGRLNIGPNSTIVQYAEDFIPERGVSLCRSFTRDGKCGSCRACWSKDVETIVYPAHGHRMNRVYKEKIMTV